MRNIENKVKTLTIDPKKTSKEATDKVEYEDHPGKLWQVLQQEFNGKKCDKKSCRQQESLRSYA